MSIIRRWLVASSLHCYPTYIVLLDKTKYTKALKVEVNPNPNKRLKLKYATGYKKHTNIKLLISLRRNGKKSDGRPRKEANKTPVGSGEMTFEDVLPIQRRSKNLSIYRHIIGEQIFELNKEPGRG